MVSSEAARTGTIETRRSWLVAWSALGILCVSLGAPLITVVALKPIAAEFGNIRSVPSSEAAELAKFVDAYVRTLEASEFDRRLRAIEAMDSTRRVCAAT